MTFPALSLFFKQTDCRLIKDQQQLLKIKVSSIITHFLNPGSWKHAVVNVGGFMNHPQRREGPSRKTSP